MEKKTKKTDSTRFIFAIIATLILAIGLIFALQNSVTKTLIIDNLTQKYQIVLDQIKDFEKQNQNLKFQKNKIINELQTEKGDLIKENIILKDEIVNAKSALGLANKSSEYWKKTANKIVDNISRLNKEKNELKIKLEEVKKSSQTQISNLQLQLTESQNLLTEAQNLLTIEQQKNNAFLVKLKKLKYIFDKKDIVINNLKDWKVATKKKFFDLQQAKEAQTEKHKATLAKTKLLLIAEQQINTELSVNLNELKSSLVQAVRDIECLEDWIVMIEKKSFELRQIKEKQAQNFNKKIAGLKFKLEQAEKNMAILVDNHKIQLAKVTTSTQTQITELNNKIAEIQKAHKEKIKKLNSTWEERKNKSWLLFKKQKSILIESIRRLKKEIERIQKLDKARVAQIIELRAKIQKITKEKQNLKANLTKASVTIASTEKKNYDLTGKLSRQMTKYSNVECQLQQAEEKLKKASAAIASAGKNVSDLTGKLSNLATKYSALECQLQQAEEKLEKKLKKEELIYLNTFFFNTGSSQVKDKAKIQKIIKQLDNLKPNQRVLIVGQADKQRYKHNHQYKNQMLSVARAREVFKQLLKNGLAEETKIFVCGFGEHDDAKRIVDIYIINK